jgi:hypothetical protein
MKVTKSAPSGDHAGNWGEGRFTKRGKRSEQMPSDGARIASPESASAVVPVTVFSRKRRRVIGNE